MTDAAFIIKFRYDGTYFTGFKLERKRQVAEWTRERRDALRMTRAEADEALLFWDDPGFAVTEES